MENPFSINCKGCGKRIWLWTKNPDADMRICMDCFKKKSSGKKVKWRVNLKGLK